jgi:hypothetical protein
MAADSSSSRRFDIALSFPPICSPLAATRHATLEINPSERGRSRIPF